MVGDEKHVEQPMTAVQARAKTVKALESGAVITAQLQATWESIGRAADAGRRAVHDPWIKPGTPYPTPGQLEALCRRLTVDGYTVVYRPNADPADPRAHSFHEVSW